MATAAAARALVAAAPCVGASRDSRFFLGAKVASFAPLVSQRAAGSSLVVRAGSGLPSPTKVRNVSISQNRVSFIQLHVKFLHCIAFSSR